MIAATGGCDPELCFQLAGRRVRIRHGDDEVVDGAGHGPDATRPLVGCGGWPSTLPQPGSHDRSTPTGTLEESSAANLFEAMLAARDAEERGEAGQRRPATTSTATLMTATLLLPVPPDHGDEAKAALEAAVNDDAEVEISVMLAADADGQPISVCFASCCRPVGLGAARHGVSLPIPARIAVGEHGGRQGVPAIMDPAGPVPYRFEPEELAALAAVPSPTTSDPTSATSRRRGRSGVGPPALDPDRAGAVTGRAVLCGDRGPCRVAGGLGERRAASAHGGLGARRAPRSPGGDAGRDRCRLAREEPLLASVGAVAEPFIGRGRR